jgi:hypothetical protein
MYSCSHVFMYSCIHVFMYSCIHVFMYSCIRVFMYSCIHLFMCSDNTSDIFQRFISIQSDIFKELAKVITAHKAVATTFYRAKYSAPSIEFCKYTE